MYFMSEIECVQQKKRGNGSFKNYQNEGIGLCLCDVQGGLKNCFISLRAGLLKD
jgi:hypothetical protein